MRIFALSFSALLLAASLVCAAPVPEAAPLRLIATTATARSDTIFVTGGEVVMRSTAGDSPVPPDTRWSLEGDLLAHATSIEFSPAYWIRHRPAVPDWPAARSRHFGIVLLRRDERWTDEQLSGSIVVMAWLVDGRVEQVRVAPAAPDEGPSAQIAAVGAFELDERSRNGAAVVLVLRDNTFLAPKPLFDSQRCNDLVARMHLAPGSLASTSLTPADVAARTRKDRESLLHLAARTGRPDWVQALLAAGAQPLAEPTPLRVAAVRGRRAIVDVLLDPSRAGGRYRATHVIEARSASLDAGHTDLAAVLLDPKTLRGWDDVFPVALALRDEATLGLLSSRIKDSTLRDLRPEVVHALIDCGEVSWVKRVADAGFKLTRRCDDEGLDAWDHARLTGDPTVLAALPPMPSRGEPASTGDSSTPPLSDKHIWTEAEVASVPRLSAPLRPAVDRMLMPTVSSPGRTSGEGLSTPTFRADGSVTSGRIDYTAESPEDSWAVLTIVVEQTGLPGRVVVVDSSTEPFGRSAKKAVEAARFVPAMRDGAPVRTRITLPVIVPP